MLTQKTLVTTELIDQCSRIGITRIGDITDLDVIGVPVHIAIRPNSRTLSLSSGKGDQFEEARLGAFMEAAEASACEDVRAQVIDICSWKELKAKGKDPVPLHTMSRCRFENFDKDRPRAWVQGRSLFTGATFFAPFELVGLDYRVPSHWDTKSLIMTSGGLGANFQEELSIVHALLEVVEDDAISISEMFGACRRIRITDAIIAALNGKFEMCVEAGFQVTFQILSSPTRIPVLRCDLVPETSSPAAFSPMVGCGYGCNLDPYLAANAALLEAIQSRAVNISGARDDIIDQDYSPGNISRSPSRDFQEIDLERFDQEGAATVRDLLYRIRKYTAAQDVYHFPLATKLPNVFVSRILVPTFADTAGSDVLTVVDRLSSGRG